MLYYSRNPITTSAKGGDDYDEHEYLSDVICIACGMLNARFISVFDAHPIPGVFFCLPEIAFFGQHIALCTRRGAFCFDRHGFLEKTTLLKNERGFVYEKIEKQTIIYGAEHNHIQGDV